MDLNNFKDIYLFEYNYSNFVKIIVWMCIFLNQFS